MKKHHYLITILITILLILSICSIYFLQGFDSSGDIAHKKIINSFYNKDEDSLDAVYFGASSVTRYWIPTLAFHEEGVAVNGLATTGQPFVMMKHLMEEAKKTQDDALFIVEFRCIFKDTNTITEPKICKVTNHMKPSLTRLKAIKSGLAYMDTDEQYSILNKIDVYFPAIETIYKALTGKLDAKIPYSDYESESWNNGFIFSKLSFKSTKVPASSYNTSDKEPLPAKNEEALYDLLDYCDSIDNDILFVLSPYSANKNSYPKVNTAIHIIEERGYDVLNMNTPEMIEEIGVDWETDFYNRLHTNLSGAEKYTKYLANYIATHYELKDHRGDPAYSEWEENWKLYEQRKNEEE